MAWAPKVAAASTVPARIAVLWRALRESCVGDWFVGFVFTCFFGGFYCGFVWGFAARKLFSGPLHWKAARWRNCRWEHWTERSSNRHNRRKKYIANRFNQRAHFVGKCLYFSCLYATIRSAKRHRNQGIKWQVIITRPLAACRTYRATNFHCAG